MINRREFLQTAGAWTLGGALLPEAWAASTHPVGIQLYSVHEPLVKDPKGVLKRLATIGYRELESFQGDQGVYFGMKPTEFKKFVGDLGMTLRASHVGIDQDFEKTVGEAGEAGIKYLICPHLAESKRPNLDGYKRVAQEFNRLGEICRKNGIQFGYHNHGYPFEKMEGQVPYDLLIGQTDPKLVVFEMDLYWVVRGGADPLGYIKQYPGRFPLWHAKDMAKNNQDLNTELGKGKVDFKTLFQNSQQAGLKYAFLEHEDNYSPSLYEALKYDYTYLKNVKY
ncbi:MAG: sugar phosphate isomerase/epimerase [Ferruginibacter sp.]|nr:sugar phosphate isomerase/epimerase [Cytophagales bacterium]